MLSISVNKLKDIVNPLDNPPWCEPISEKEINSCLNPCYIKHNPLVKESKEKHIERIAFLAKHWNDEPIILTLYDNVYPIYDGNHRFCAAIYLKKEFIFAQVEGNIEKIKQIEY